MSIEAKSMLLKSMELQLSSTIPASEMAKVLSLLADELAPYELNLTDTRSVENDDLLVAYIEAMNLQGRSPKTIERYKYAITRMMSHVKIPTRRITVFHLRQYLSSEKARDISDRTLEGNRQIFSAYFNWLHREGLIEANPTANLGSIKYQKKTKAVYSDVDIERLKCHCKSIRDKAIVCFLRSTGCRISEMTQLNRSDVDLTTLECNVVGKGNKERIVYLDAVTGMLIQEYLEQRTDTYPSLFIGKGTDRLKPGGVRNMLVNLAKLSSIEHVHPHKFRRTLATSLIRHGMPIQEVATILGHDKLDTTMQYVVLDKTDIKNAYRKYT